MPTLYDDQGNPVEIPDEALAPDESHGMRELRESRNREAERAAALETENEANKRKLAFFEALPGVDLSTGTAALFFKAYDGKLEADAIKEAAVELGILAAPPPDPAATQDA